MPRTRAHTHTPIRVSACRRAGGRRDNTCTAQYARYQYVCTRCVPCRCVCRCVHVCRCTRTCTRDGFKVNAGVNELCQVLRDVRQKTPTSVARSQRIRCHHGYEFTAHVRSRQQPRENGGKYQLGGGVLNGAKLIGGDVNNHITITHSGAVRGARDPTV